MFRFKFNSTELGSLTITDQPRNTDTIDSYFVRSETYFGMNQRVEDTSFEWITESAEYIRNAINGYGCKTVITVTIEYTDNQLDYDLFYTGTLELIDFHDYGEYVSCRVTASDKESKFIKNLETRYRIALPSTLNLNPRENEFTGVFDTVKTAINRTTICYTERLYTGSNRGHRLQMFETTKTAGEQSKFNNIVSNWEDYIMDLNASEDYQMIASYSPYVNEYQNSEVVIYINQALQIYGAVTESGAGQIRLILSIAVLSANLEFKNIYDADVTAYFNPVTYDPNTPAYSVSIVGSYTIPDALAKQDRLIIGIRPEHTLISPTNSYSNVYFKFNTQGTLLISATEYKNATVHRCISMARAFNRLAYRTIYNSHPTIDPALVTGDIFTSDFKDTVLTSGTELRQFTGGDGKMTTTFAELFAALSVPFCLGMGVTKQGDSISVVVDHRSQFFQPKVVWDLGEVSDLEIEFDEKFVYNALNIDYPSNSNQNAANGIYEFVTKYGYTTPCNYVDNALENTTGFKADGTSIEEARTNEIADTTENQADDNTNFMIRCRVSGGEYYISNGEEYPTLNYSGVQNTTQLVNLDMFPPMTLRFWAWWILAAFEHETEDIQIQRNEANGMVSFTIDGIIYDTNDITIDRLRTIALAQPYTFAHGTLFDPFMYTFRTPVTAKFIQAYSGNRHGVIQFSYKGETHYGFPWKIPAMPKTDGQFILLKLSKRGRSYV